MAASTDKKTVGIITNVQRMSVHDGPGIRTTVFMKGCPLHCIWCHNPETQSARVQLAYHANRCKGCGVCAEHCPSGAISLSSDGKIKRDASKCVLCMRCTEVCPWLAWEKYGKEITSAELCALLAKDKEYYKQSGGGVTFSGGEPLSQHRFVTHCAAELRTMGIHTAVETSCFGDSEALAEMASVTELFMVDIKNMDDARHLEQTGGHVQPVLSNLCLLSSLGASVLIRIPIVKGFNDSDENIENTARFLLENTVFRRVELLRMHKLAESKYTALGRDYAAMRLDVPDMDTVMHSAEILKRHGIEVIYGGNVI